MGFPPFLLAPSNLVTPQADVILCETNDNEQLVVKAGEAVSGERFCVVKAGEERWGISIAEIRHIYLHPCHNHPDKTIILLTSHNEVALTSSTPRDTIVTALTRWCNVTVSTEACVPNIDVFPADLLLAAGITPPAPLADEAHSEDESEEPANESEEPANEEEEEGELEDESEGELEGELEDEPQEQQTQQVARTLRPRVEEDESESEPESDPDLTQRLGRQEGDQKDVELEGEQEDDESEEEEETQEGQRPKNLVFESEASRS